MSDQPATGSWELSPFRRSVFVIAAIVLVVIAVLGVTRALSARGSMPVPFTVIWLVIWLGISGLIFSRYLRSATRLAISADGRIEARRPIGTITTEARRVTRIGRSIWGQNHGRPVTIRTVDGKILLASGFPSTFDIATAVRAHNPGVDIDL